MQLDFVLCLAYLPIITISISIHIVPGSRILIFNGWILSHCNFEHSLCIHQLMETNWFPVSAFVYNIAINRGAKMVLLYTDLMSFVHIVSCRIVRSYGNSFKKKLFWGISMIAVLNYIPTNSVQEFPFLTSALVLLPLVLLILFTLTGMWYCVLTIVNCFSWALMMLRIFPCNTTQLCICFWEIPLLRSEAHF